ncbi:MAG: dUTP diphosphatase [Clostridiales bacterium]|nr:dUTP diphosphatase [Clostridiales bacterium]
MRRFDIVKEEFIKYGVSDITMPTRATKHSAGYDLYSPIDIVIKPHTIETVWTNIKIACNEDEFIMLCVRSSMGRKGVILANGVGILDADYYGNPSTDGNIGVTLNNTADQDYVIKKGDRIGQVVFLKYLTIDDEEEVKASRLGAFGSTDNK